MKTKVALFVTCLADHYFADAAADAVRLLRRLGCDVDFPRAQTCCGQPAYNAGRTDDARAMARHAVEVFGNEECAVVLPSGSCATMVKKFYPRILDGAAGDGAVDATSLAAGAPALSTRAFELAEFVVHELGVVQLGVGLAGKRIALHQGCHALRELRLDAEPRTLLEGAGAEIVPWEAGDECCGFGGLFSVKMTAVSAAMADRKLEALPDGVDWVVSGDGGCLLQMEGRSRVLGREDEFVHLATALWRGVGGSAVEERRAGPR